MTGYIDIDIIFKMWLVNPYQERLMMSVGLVSST
jgi:hypothetical protein